MTTAVTADPRIGTEIAGYRIESLLGRGGMGVVYLAKDPWLERMVALKLIAPEVSENPRFRARFLRESKLAASLEHAHVVPIYEAGDAEGLLYLAMRYIDGEDLNATLEEKKALAPETTLWLIERVATALDAAHAKGLVHRDVKPGNILVAGEPGADDASVYLSDFGLTKHATEELSLTDAGQVLGTLDYIAPEQIEDAPVVAQSDIYSLGCVLYQCLTGSLPYPKEARMAVLWAHLNQAPPRLTELDLGLPAALDDGIATALAKDPGERYGSCRELVDSARVALGETAPVVTLAVRVTQSVQGPAAIRGRGRRRFLRAGRADGKRMATTSTADELFLWDLEHRTRIGGNFPGLFQAVSPWAWARQGVSALGNSIVVWNLDTDDWFDIACRAAGRNMTRAEWDEHGPADDQYSATCPEWSVEGETPS